MIYHAVQQLSPSIFAFLSVDNRDYDYNYDMLCTGAEMATRGALCRSLCCATLCQSLVRLFLIFVVASGLSRRLQDAVQRQMWSSSNVCQQKTVHSLVHIYIAHFQEISR